MRLLFLCDARIQESLSEGVSGEARLPKNNRNNVFTVIHGAPNIFQGGGGGGGVGVQHFQGGSRCLFP